MIDAQMEQVTPAFARKIMQQQDAIAREAGKAINRKITPGRVESYARQMGDGKWKANGEPIILNGQRLLDGQHRLLAVIEAGVTVPMLVVRGVSPDAFDTIDQNLTRSAGDLLSLRGFACANHIAGAAAMVMEYREFGTMRMQAKKMPAPSEIVRFAAAHAGEFVHASNVAGEAKRVVGLPTILIAVAFLTSDSGEARRVFFEGLTTGVNLGADSPVRHLRERLIAARTNRTMKVPTSTRAAWIAKAWNAYIQGRPMKTLRFSVENGESFPVIVQG